MKDQKKEYITADIELVFFDENDIVTASVPDKNEDDDGWTAV